MIDPSGFGCSAKLSYAETVALASASTPSTKAIDFDCRQIAGVDVLSSIDQIFRCSKDWDTYADIAISHAIADVCVGGAIPSSLSISFAFGPDTEINVSDDMQISERQCATLAFYRAAQRKGLTIGKCHSVFTNDPTNVTISTFGVRDEEVCPAPKRGAIYLGGKIGGAKALYLSEIGLFSIENDTLLQLRSTSEISIMQNPAVHTDVSGHGLAGAALLACLINGWDADLTLGLDCVVSPETLDYPAGCIQNDVDSYGVNFSCSSAEAEIICTLRETSGPILSFVERLEQCKTAFPCIGHFGPGEGKVSASWRS